MIRTGEITPVVPDTSRSTARWAALLLLCCVALSGCTSRGITITSLPEGAEVSVNRRVVGHTPIRVNFNYYGVYRIELRKERFQTIVREEDIKPAFYGYDPITFFADNIVPMRINDETYLHYVMKPVSEDFDKDTLMARAVAARTGKVVHPITHKPISVPVGGPSPTDGGAGQNNTPPQPKLNPDGTPVVEPEKKPAIGNALGLTAPEPAPPAPAAPVVAPNPNAPPADPNAVPAPPPAVPATPDAPKARRIQPPEGLPYDEKLREDPSQKK